MSTKKQLILNKNKIINALFSEYNKKYKKTKPGQIYPKWLDEEQLNWVITVFNKVN